MSDNDGFVVMHRKIMSWEWYTDVNTAHLFRHCILRANFKDTSWRGIEIKQGSFVTSLETLSKETGLSVMQVRTALKKLMSTGEITSRATSKYRIITVKNYVQYQSRNKQNNKQNNKRITGRSTSKQQSDNKQITTDNNDNNETMKTSEGLCPAGTKPSHKETKQAASPDTARGRVSAAPQKSSGAAESSGTDKTPPLSTSEWVRYSESRGMSGEDIWEEWERLDNGRRLTDAQITEIRGRINGRKAES